MTVYAATGVDIAAGERAVALMGDAVRSTYGPEVLAGLGAFGGLFDIIGLRQMRAPVLVASTDGVGTKVKLAAQAGRYEPIGHDIVNHCLNDILVSGGRPLFFMDYIAASKLDPQMAARVVAGMAAACRAAGCALLGGETAEMPGVYAPGEFDVAGTMVGVVERDHILPRADLQPGDVLLGLRSSGPHTNGYSLIRQVFAGVPLDTVFPELGLPLADALLAPHRAYGPLVLPVLAGAAPRATVSPAAGGAHGVTPAAGGAPGPIKALVHLTGGGWFDNIPRVLPDGLGAVVHLGSWNVPPLFQMIQARGQVPVPEMYRVFNMGIGMLLVAAAESVPALQSAIPEPTFVVGELVAGGREVRLA